MSSMGISAKSSGEQQHPGNRSSKNSIDRRSFTAAKTPKGSVGGHVMSRTRANRTSPTGKTTLSEKTSDFDREGLLDGPASPMIGEETSGFTNFVDEEPTSSKPESPTVDKHRQQTDDYDTDLDPDDSNKAFDLSGRRFYIESCKKLGVVPAKYFITHIESDTMNISHHGLGPTGAIALCFPLQSNTCITYLDLSDNFIGPDGVAAVAWMLHDNVYITTLKLSGNKLGGRGMKHICRLLRTNLTVTTLDISCNEFTDEDGISLAQTIAENKFLTSLDISGNEFGAYTASALNPALQENDILTYLNLSWNHFRFKSAVPICKCLKHNVALRVYDLSFLGLAKEGAKALCDALMENHVLQELYINECRLGADGALLLCKMLVANKTLKVLKMAGNDIRVSSAVAILQALIKNTESAVTDLDFGNMEVDRHYVEIETPLIESREIVVKRGKMLSDYTIKGIYVQERTIMGLKIPEFQSCCPLVAMRNFAVENDVAIFQDLVDYLLKKNVTKMDKKDVCNLAKYPEFKLSFDQQNVFDKNIMAMAEEEGQLDVSAFVNYLQQNPAATQ